MGRSTAAFALAASLVVAACSSAPSERSAAQERGRALEAPPSAVTGMDGRPPFESGSSSSPRPPGWIDGNDEVGPTGPPAAIVPDVRGMVFEQAVRRLWEAGIGFGLVVARASERDLWSVLEQNPPPGSDTPDSGEIDLILSMRSTGSISSSQLRQCDPAMENLSDPYCLGKRLQYFE